MKFLILLFTASVVTLFFSVIATAEEQARIVCIGRDSIDGIVRFRVLPTIDGSVKRTVGFLSARGQNGRLIYDISIETMPKPPRSRHRHAHYLCELSAFVFDANGRNSSAIVQFATKESCLPLENGQEITLTLIPAQPFNDFKPLPEDRCTMSFSSEN